MKYLLLLSIFLIGCAEIETTLPDRPPRPKTPTIYVHSISAYEASVGGLTRQHHHWYQFRLNREPIRRLGSGEAGYVIRGLLPDKTYTLKLRDCSSMGRCSKWSQHSEFTTLSLVEEEATEELNYQVLFNLNVSISFNTFFVYSYRQDPVNNVFLTQPIDFDLMCIDKTSKTGFSACWFTHLESATIQFIQAGYDILTPNQRVIASLVALYRTFKTVGLLTGPEKGNAAFKYHPDIIFEVRDELQYRDLRDEIEEYIIEHSKTGFSAIRLEE